MYLHQLIEGLGLCVVRGDGSAQISGLSDDSRTVRPGDAFVARRGTTGDGGAYIHHARQQGAAAIITDQPPPHTDTAGKTAQPNQPRIAWVQGPNIDHRLVGRLAQRFFDHPSAKLKLIGVTGTNGKTTTAFLIQHLLRQAGVRCGMIGTVWVDDGQARTPATLTTPGAIELCQQLAKMADNGCQAAVLEVSSHALDQGRTAAIRFDVGLLTNLTGDHLDYHGDMDRYAAAKAKLFESLPDHGAAVLNAAEPWSQRMVQGCGAQVSWCHVGFQNQPDGPQPIRADCRATTLKLAPNHSHARFDGPWGSVEARLPLVGPHNVTNALQALAAADKLTDLVPILPGALEQGVRVPGRLELVGHGPHHDQADGPTVLVDYAHTHDALEQVLSTLRPVTPERLIVVFGCGGDRDRTKRPKMAAAACQLAHRVVITSDNPRTEDPNQIIDEILTGVPAESRDHVVVCPDRASAIQQAIAQANPGDTVLLAGKGHEDYQIIGTMKRPFDDRSHAATALHHRSQQLA